MILTVVYYYNYYLHLNNLPRLPLLGSQKTYKGKIMK